MHHARAGSILPYRAGLGWVGGECGIAGLRGPRLGHSFWADEAYAVRAYVWLATRERLPEVAARLGGDGYETVADFPGWEPMFGYRVLQKRPMGLRKRPSDSDGHPAGITAAGDREDGVARAAQ
jgi:hypothetical protein